MMRIAPAKAQALPSTIDERRAKIRKASLTTQKKSRDSSCFLSFSFCVFIAIILYSRRAQAGRNAYQCRSRSCGAALRRPAIDRPLNDGKLSRARNRPRARSRPPRRVLADVLLAVVLKTADAMERIIPYLFHAAPIFIDHCARGQAEIFHRFAGVRHATLCFFSRLRRNRRALIHLVFVSHRFL